jgi:hypothetical protein
MEFMLPHETLGFVPQYHTQKNQKQKFVSLLLTGLFWLLDLCHQFWRWSGILIEEIVNLEHWTFWYDKVDVCVGGGCCYSRRAWCTWGTRSLGRLPKITENEGKFFPSHASFYSSHIPQILKVLLHIPVKLECFEF